MAVPALSEQGLAYRKEAPVNWCPNDQTVLANEQVVDGKCDRCGAEVELRKLDQWFFRITAYADALLDDHAIIDWPERTKAIQRNWIGRSEGADILFRIDDLDIDVEVFTTRPDTLFGATFFVLAPEHPLVAARRAHAEAEVLRSTPRRAAVERVEEREETKEKTGVFTGRHVTNPATGEQIPVWVADYVLMAYGTGAIMAVPATTSATSRSRSATTCRSSTASTRTRGTLVDSGDFTGLSAEEGKRADRGLARGAAPGRPRCASACATGPSRGSATGAARSRSSTATSAGSCRCPRTSCRWCCPRSRTTGRRASRRSPPTRSG